MDLLNDHEFYKFNPNSLYEIRKGFDLEKPGAMSEAVEIFEEWLKKQAHFVKKDFDRGYLERAIIRAKGSVEKAKQRLDKLCTSRTLIPEFFVNIRTNEFEDVDPAQDVMLPHPTSDHYRIFLCKNIGKDFNNNFFLNYYRRCIQIMEHQYAHDYVNGIEVIIDLRECSVAALLRHMDIGDFKNIINISLVCYGLRIKAIHFMSESHAIQALVALFKQVLSAKLGSRIYVHRTLETLHQQIDKNLLPVEYGGAQKSLSELFKQYMDMLSRDESLEYMKMMNAARTDEAYRLTDKFNEQCIGLPGTFRSLKLD